MRLASTLSLLPAVCLALVASAAGEAPKTPPFRYVWAKAYYVLPETHNHESGYKSLCEGLNGKIYIGTAKYGVNGYLVEFDPATEKQRIAVDAAAVTGATGTGHAAQAKIHTRNHVGPSGTIYIGSKQGYPSRAERDAVDIPPYPGGYVIAYDPKTNTSRSLGMPWPGFGVIDVVSDEPRGLIYATMCEDPYAWMAADLNTARWRWLGPELVVNGQTLVDHRGRANAITWDFKLARYDPAANKLTTQPITLDGEKLTRTRADTRMLALWNLATDGRTAYVTILDRAQLFRIDLGGDDKGAVPMTTLGTLVEGPNPDSRCCLTIAPDGRVYAVVSVQNDTGYGTGRRLHHLGRYDPATNRCEDLGVLAVKNPDFFNFAPGPDGKKPANSHGYHTLPDGTLTPLHNTMALTAAHDGTLYATVLYPFTLLRIDPAALQETREAEKK